LLRQILVPVMDDVVNSSYCIFLPAVAVIEQNTLLLSFPYFVHEHLALNFLYSSHYER